MKGSKILNVLSLTTGILMLVTIFMFSGCATKEYVGQQIQPVSDRISQAEGRITKVEGQIPQLDSKITADQAKISSLESGLAKTDAKADRALASLGNLKVERKLVLATDKKDGANFDNDSAKLSDKAKKEIDSFIGDLASDQNATIVVAGYTDSRGSDDYNFTLGKRRAEAVSHYLMVDKNINPLHVITVSYGKNAPVADNKTKDGRAKNRRVEISVYREAINVSGNK